MVRPWRIVMDDSDMGGPASQAASHLGSQPGIQSASQGAQLFEVDEGQESSWAAAIILSQQD